MKTLTAPRICELITAHRMEFMLGLLEWNLGVGTTYDDDPESNRSQAYDLGRTLGEALSLSTDEYCDHIYDSYCPNCGIDSAEELA